jgi:DNA-binding GntR family transcriptional regulator
MARPDRKIHPISPTSSRPRERSRSLKQSIYQQLRERIIFQELKPGEFLNETRLASELGVSRTVLREILQRLIADGLLLATPGQGVHVQGIDLLMLKSAYEMRVPLEGLAGRLAAERAQPVHIQALEKLIAQGEEAAQQKDYRQMARLDWEFHRVIGEAVRNELLASTLLRLLMPFNRLWYIAMVDHGKIGNFVQEWREVVAALKRRQAAAAEKALVEHMVATPAVISPVLSLTRSP